MDEYMAMYCSNPSNLNAKVCACYSTTTATPLCSDRVCQVHGYKSLKVSS